MKNSFVILLALCLFSLQLAAQKASRQYPGKVKYQKTEQDATVFDVPYPANQVEDGLKDMFQKKGVKVKEKNGFYEAPSVKMDQHGVKSGDVYYKVVKDGKNDCKIYIILTEAGEAPESRTSSHADIAAGAGLGTGAVLGGIAPALDEYDFSIVKAKQEEEVKKAEKVLNVLVEEMERRYALFEEAGMRNIDDYNHSSSHPIRKIVCVIDEFADLEGIHGHHRATALGSC
jgi:hypothetical protein